MSLLASCPHEWKFWQMMEIEEDYEIHFYFELEANDGNYYYPTASIPFSPSEFYLSIKSLSPEVKDENFFSNIYSQNDISKIKIKNSHGECWINFEVTI